jgi:two-component system, chemotaxis family, protein-glutamate methylesterase/glutaminase
MPPIRILVVDDSAIIRKVIREGLAADSAIEVVGTAANGLIALEKIPQLHPDLVTLDIEMPDMDGLQTVAEIRKSYPKLPVIMFSTLTERGASSTLEALARGANDYVTKPGNTGSLEKTLSQIREQLIPKVKALCYPIPATTAFLTQRPAVPARPVRADVPVQVLAIGASTGGPNALAELLPGIPKDFPVPVVVVQHMPPVFTRLFAARLNDRSNFEVHEGQAGETLKAGDVWIAPGDFHMTVERQGTSVRLAINQDPPENSCRPAVDPLFRSVARVYGAGALSVVLTGMGSDGVNGAQHIRERGGRVLVQDESSSVVWGMPGQVAAAGLADGIYPLNSMAGEIVRRVSASRNLSLRSPEAVGYYGTLRD